MSRVKSKNTRPEIIVRSELHKLGYRFRLNNRKIPGTPDLTLKKYKLAIFVNGCFWHGHDNCKYANPPKSRIEFWTEKIKRNKNRDLQNKVLLKQIGWKIITIWECEIKRNKGRISDFLKEKLDGQE